MPSFGKWQTASEEAECSECPKPIKPGEVYMRLGFVDSDTWRALTGEGKTLLYRGDHIESNLNGWVVKRLWEAVSANDYPISKVHRRCWLGLAEETQFTQRSSTTVAPRR